METLLVDLKDLLLKDLSARLPYGVKGINQYGEIVNLDHQTDYSSYMSIKNAALKHGWKPYLFPLPSMTEEQEKELNLYLRLDKEPIMRSVKEIDWYNKNHFDYRGLIEKGLAIDATNLNIY